MSEKSEAQFIRFTEVNDWEGETWSFWLQVEGNGPELLKLKNLIAPFSEYRMSLDDREPEWVVDKVVEYATSGYFDSHVKVTGKLTCPEAVHEKWGDGDQDYDDVFHKGGIRDFFESA